MRRAVLRAVMQHGALPTSGTACAPPEPSPDETDRAMAGYLVSGLGTSAGTYAHRLALWLSARGQGERATAWSAIAAAAITDPHLFDASSGLDEAVRRLRSICGVGEGTAQYIALRQLREPDAFPAADTGLMQAMARQAGRPYSASELLDRASAWRPWRAYAAQHLWASD